MTVLESLLNILPIVSLTIVLFYYSYNIRSQTIMRQVQMFNSIAKDINNEKLWKQYWESFDLEWESFEDFDKKYGRRANSEVCASLNSMFWTFSGIGSLLKEGIIKPDRTYELVGPMVVPLWEKWSPIIEGLRTKWGTPDSYRSFEYVCREMTKMRDQRHANEVVKKYASS